MGLFDLFKSKKTQSEPSKKTQSEPSKKMHKKKQDRPSKKNIKYFSTDEVTLIIKPEIANRILFYDLKGNRISKIPPSKRDLSVDNKCYLGLKKYNKTERWVPIKSLDVEKKLKNNKFISLHSLSDNKKGKINAKRLAKLKFTPKPIFFSFGGEFYKRAYKWDGPETYNIKHPTLITYRAKKHHDAYTYTEDFSKAGNALGKYKVTRYEMIISKPISYVRSTGYWGRKDGAPHWEFECPFDDELSDDENKTKIKNFCDTLNDVLSAGSVKNYQLKINEIKNKVTNDLSQKFVTDKKGIINITKSDDFLELIRNNNKLILEISKSDNKQYLQLFVKLHNFLKSKEKNIKIFYNYINSDEVEMIAEIDNAKKSIEKQIESYRLILYNSLAMVHCLCKEDMLTFYQIYECFDKLKIWNSNWENEMTKELNNVNKKLKIIIRKINSLEQNIIESFSVLNNTILGGFESLQSGITKELKTINSTIDYGNLFNAISTYQLYKINKQTKGLNE